MKNTVTLLLIFLISAFYVQAQKTDTLDLRSNKLIVSNLNIGTKDYLVYFVTPKGKTGNLWLWKRTVQKANRNGQEVLEFTQHWSSSDTTNFRHLYSISSASDFKPIYHFRQTGPKKEAFNFSEEKITGADSVADNLIKDLSVTSKVLPYNWELDLEVFQTLPYKTGKQFAINFYHPGGRTGATYYLYKVIGEEKIAGSNAQTIDCWKLKIDYTTSSWATFWISKKSKEVIKMQEFFNGNYRYKVLLTTNP